MVQYITCQPLQDPLGLLRQTLGVSESEVSGVAKTEPDTCTVHMYSCKDAYTYLQCTCIMSSALQVVHQVWQDELKDALILFPPVEAHLQLRLGV